MASKRMSVRRLNSVTTVNVESIRIKFLELAKQRPQDYDPIDVDRIRNNDFAVRRFLLVNDGDQKKAFNSLNETMQWRRCSGVNQLDASRFVPFEMFKTGLRFEYNCDRDGRPVVYIRIKSNVPIITNDEWVAKIMIGTAERMDRLANDKSDHLKRGYVLVFDFTGSGWLVPTKEELSATMASQKVMNHYPEGIAYVVVFNAPWLVRKTIVPLVRMIWGQRYVDKIKVAQGKELFQYIEPNQVPGFLGGCCSKDFTEPPVGFTRSFDEIAEEFGYEKKDIDKFKCKLVPFVKEAEELAKIRGEKVIEDINNN